LIEIRDQDTRVLTEGQGYVNLFSDVSSINRELQDEDATYRLFKTIHEKDPKLARQCYVWIESLLVAKGEYQWCFDYMGDPQFRFDSIRRSFDMERGSQQRMVDMRKRLAEEFRKNSLTNVWSPPDTSGMEKRSAENRFVGSVCQLIEILVATDHRADAEKIRDRAVTVLDDERLKSAVGDAEQKIANRAGKKSSGP